MTGSSTRILLTRLLEKYRENYLNFSDNMPRVNDPGLVYLICGQLILIF